jgi:hypothetical protein
MITNETKTMRAKLATHRANLKQNFALFQDHAATLIGKGIVRHSGEKGRYEDCVHAAGRSVSLKERQTVAAFLRLQTNLAHQALLIVELETSIDREEAK